MAILRGADGMLSALPGRRRGFCNARKVMDIRSRFLLPASPCLRQLRRNQRGIRRYARLCTTAV